MKTAFAQWITHGVLVTSLIMLKQRANAAKAACSKCLLHVHQKAAACWRGCSLCPQQQKEGLVYFLCRWSHSPELHLQQLCVCFHDLCCCRVCERLISITAWLLWAFWINPPPPHNPQQVVLVRATTACLIPWYVVTLSLRPKLIAKRNLSYLWPC